MSNELASMTTAKVIAEYLVHQNGYQRNEAMQAAPNEKGSELWDAIEGHIKRALKQQASATRKKQTAKP